MTAPRERTTDLTTMRIGKAKARTLE